ncbi:MAG TPA: hypothetical protein VGH14_15555, partial [Solirubrobacterales bacterium]
PNLPILAELEGDVTRAAERALGGATPPRAEPVHPRRSRRPTRRQGGRVARRALLLVALLLLVGATALAATGVFDEGGTDKAVRGPAFDAAHGSVGGGYRLVLHPHGRSLCRVLVVSGGVASKCQRAPRPGEVQALSAMGTNRRFVFGVTGAGERSIVIQVGSRRIRIHTHRLDAGEARADQIDPRVRVFVATFPPSSRGASQPPAIVAGKPDCSLTSAPVAACRPG